MTADERRRFYARDRDRLLSAAAGLTSKTYARPADALEDCLRLSGYSVCRAPLPGLWGLLDTEARQVTLDPAQPASQVAFTLAHELGHIRLHARRCMTTGPTEEREADEYATEFLLPEAALVTAAAACGVSWNGQAGVSTLARAFDAPSAVVATKLRQLGVLRATEASLRVR